MKILLSIKPEFVAKILSGEKRFEYRKALHKEGGVKTVLVYSTKPVAKLVCEFDIASVIKASPEDLWRETHRWSGITKEFFDAYFAKRRYAFALAISNVREFEAPRDPSEMFDNFVAPQSFRYVGASIAPRTPELPSLFPELQ